MPKTKQSQQKPRHTCGLPVLLKTDFPNRGRHGGLTNESSLKEGVLVTIAINGPLTSVHNIPKSVFTSISGIYSSFSGSQSSDSSVNSQT